jgi:hypothetical protein
MKCITMSIAMEVVSADLSVSRREFGLSFIGFIPTHQDTHLLFPDRKSRAEAPGYRYRASTPRR